MSRVHQSDPATIYRLVCKSLNQAPCQETRFELMQRLQNGSILIQVLDPDPETTPRLIVNVCPYGPLPLRVNPAPRRGSQPRIEASPFIEPGSRW